MQRPEYDILLNMIHFVVLPFDKYYWQNVNMSICYIYVYVQSVSKKNGEVFVQFLYIWNIYLYIFIYTILYHSGLYSFLTDEKWAYGRNLEIIHHNDQLFIFLKIFLQFVCLFVCFGCGLVSGVQVLKNYIL